MNLFSKIALLLFILFAGCPAATPAILAQTGAEVSPVRFSATEIRQVALQVSGDASNWPIVLELAEHNSVDNSFLLSPASRLQLQNFAQISAEVREMDRKKQDLIKNGASVFAKDALQETEDLQETYRLAVKAGNIKEAENAHSLLVPVLERLEEDLNAGRIVDVEAELSNKKGEVEKRKGILGTWLEALIGDLFKQADGLKTYEDSYANLSFTDGSEIVVEPNTVAVIRKSRIDRLDQSSDTEITLENGGLLAKLSAASKNKSTYILNAGASTSRLRTQNFYAEADSDENVKLTNYDGEAVVNASDVTISLNKDEGTIIEKGKAPLPPIQLLPAPLPVFNTSDTLIFDSEIMFSFNPVEKAMYYHLQYSNTGAFNDQVNALDTEQNSVLIADLPVGSTYIRVQAVDSLGLKGPYSEALHVKRNTDNKPPPLFVDGAFGNIIFTTDGRAEITGITEAGAGLFIDGKEFPLNAAGRFRTSVNGVSTERVMEIRVLDETGNRNEVRLRIIQLNPEKLFTLKLRGATQSGDSIIPEGELVSVSGTAWPQLKVQLEHAGRKNSVRTASDGKWGISFRATTAPLILRFSHAETGKLYFEKEFILDS